MAQHSPTHPAPSDLHAFLLGRMSANDLARVESHVEGCAHCCDVLSRLEDDRLVELARAAHSPLAATRSDAATDAPASPESSGSFSSDVQPVLRGEDRSPVAHVQPSPADAIPVALRDHPRYRVLRVLGRGGMGTVYLAEHRLMRRTVALKVINSQFTSNRQAVERFQQEMRIVARLTSPHVVTAHDAEQVGDSHFLVMEYIDGKNLAEVVRQRGPLPILQACRIARQACLGLQHAHEHGLVHRDIKPQNLMLTKAGRVKILDLGLARLGPESRPKAAVLASNPELTAHNALLGTPDYMAPEQAVDPTSANVRSDLYSLGGTLFFLLTGEPPFESGSFAKMLVGDLRTPRSLHELRDDLPQEVVDIVTRLLADNPGDRFASAAEVAEALAPLGRGPEASGLLSRWQGWIDGVVKPALAVPRIAGETLTRGALPWLSGSRRWLLLILLAVGIASFGYGPLARWYEQGRPPLMASNVTRNSTLPPSPPPTSGDRALQDAEPSRPTPAIADNAGTNDAPQDRSTLLSSQVAPANPVATVLFLVPATDFYWPEVTAVMRPLEAARVRVTVVSWSAEAKVFGGKAPPVRIPLLLADADPGHFDALVIAGGLGLLELLKDTPQGTEGARLVRKFAEAGKPVGALSLGPAVMAKAGVLKDVPVTANPAIATDFQREFGVTLTAQPIERRQNLLTARDAQAAPEFVAELLLLLRDRPTSP